MAAGGWSLDHEAVDLAGAFSGERHGQRGGGDDRQELRPLERRFLAGQVLSRVEPREELFARQGTDHIELEFRGFPGGKAIKDRRDRAGNAGTHQHHIDSGEHRPE